MDRGRKAQRYLLLAIAAGALTLAQATPASAVKGFVLGAGSPHATGGNAGSIATGDLDKDGHPDLVVAGASPGSIQVLLGDGMGGFVPGVSPAVSGGTPSAVAVGLVNAGTNPDVVLALTGPSNETKLAVLLGDGAGGLNLFQPAQDFGDTCPIDLALGQLNPEIDSTLDVAVTAACDNSVLTIYGDGNGAFSTADSNLTGGTAPTGVAVADLIGTSDAEVVVSHISSDNVAVFQRDTALNIFQPIVGSPFASGAASLRGVALGPLDNDADSDIAVAAQTTDAVAILGAPSFAPILDSPFGTGAGHTGPWSVAIADFDGFGGNDLVTANENTNDAIVQFNNLGDFDPFFAGPISLGPGLQDAQDVVTADFNLDSHPDFATSNGVTGTVSVLINDFRPPHPPEVTGTDPDSPADDNSIFVKGTVEELVNPGTHVDLYSGVNCNSPIDHRAASEFASPGIPVTVGDNSTTTFSARVSDGQGTSGCSTVTKTYVEDSSTPAAPTLSATQPGSPSNDETPDVQGSAELGSMVRVYDNAGCSGSPLGMGSAAALGTGSLNITVPENMTTTLFATATDAALHVSPCSATPLPYQEDSVAPGEPTSLGTSPASPAIDPFPEVGGAAPAGTTVRIYSTAGCTGPHLASGPAATFASPGITVNATATSTTFRARAVDPAGNVSPCSGSSVLYELDSTPPPAPVMGGTSPGSPANANQPTVNGSAQADSVVRLFGNATCAGPPLTVGSAASFVAPGFSVLVADNSTTSFSANASDQLGNVSACSPAPATYVEDSTAPETLLDRVRVKQRKRVAVAEFHSDEAGASFVCRVDERPFGRCDSPEATGRLGRGAHLFEVQALDRAGNADATVAGRRFRIRGAR